MSSLAERATLNFYQWEARGRGYVLSDSHVSIEPPYVPFHPVSASSDEYIDDGRVPSLLSQFKSLVASPKEQQREPSVDIVPTVIEALGERVCLSISFPKDTDIAIEKATELLHLLCYSQEAFSFEILAQEGKIIILFTASEEDGERLQSQLKAFFPQAILKPIAWDIFDFDVEEPVAICDFALDNEFMLPTAHSQSLSIDPLTSVVATLTSLQEHETAVVQILFKGLSGPWSQDTYYASSDGKGGSFFEGYPDFINGVEQKLSSPLFGVVFRIATQGKDEYRSQYIAQELARDIATISRSEYNGLIPLSNEGYEYEDHLRNVYLRSSNRLGFILNATELAHFVHYPNKTVSSSKLGLDGGKTKHLSQSIDEGITIGVNEHEGQEYPVVLDTESLLSHCHIIGSTGVGKSTLVANAFLGHLEKHTKVGGALFDPHGDIVEDVLRRIPKDRINDVVLIDPSDSEYPIGFNLLQATTDAEKIVLSSDLIGAFKRHATAWGDNMTAVLSNAINTFTESTKGGTLIELKRFLIEKSFRKEFLHSVDDPSLHYYWEHEYPMMRKGISPLLTRIDTFLRPKLVRYMVAQRQGVDIAKCMKENKIVLLKLSQGLIGESNSFLLGSLFLAKFNQAALGRQNIAKDKRTPYFLMCDEFQNYITDSMESILSGARKYGLSLTLVHQDLEQIRDAALLNSVLSNPKIRICFRLGDSDAKRLESGFSYFEQSDLQSLERGKAIMRIGSSKNDFNLMTYPLSEVVEDYSKEIIDRTRNLYATPKADVEALLETMLPKLEHKSQEKVPSIASKSSEDKKPAECPKEEQKPKTETSSEASISEEQREQLIESENESREIRTHNYLQTMIRKLGQDRNFKASTEYETEDGGRIDVVLERDGIKMGFEISETNKPSYEVKNIKKCLKAGCVPTVVISKNKKHLQSIQQLAIKELSKKDMALVYFLQPNEISDILDQCMTRPQRQEEVVKGFRIVTEIDGDEDPKIKRIKTHIARLFKGRK